MEVPLYCLVGKIPVKSFFDPETDKLVIHAYNYEDGNFSFHMEYFFRLYLSSQDNTTFLSREEFENYVLELKSKSGKIE